tara:strand:- start:2459 stop:2749 length:291 start_codon:yes stop_codon:yes gene_type:complete
MRGMIVRFRVGEDRSEDFERAIQRIATISAEEDSGYEYYSAARVDGDPTSYVVVERFTDEAALRAHMGNPRISEAMAAVEASLTDAPAITHVEFLP